jgi:DNA polymerase I-like protein with 3'-5' exonuclease and polymerase domains
MAILLDAKQAAELPPGMLRDWAYNALDVTGTREVYDTLLPRLNAETARTYAFEKALQAPALAMTRRGVRVDLQAKATALTALRRKLAAVTKAINKLPLVTERWDLMAKVTGACPAEIGKHHKWPRGVPDGPDRRCERCGASRMALVPFNPVSSDHCAHLFYDLYGVKPYHDHKTHAITCDADALEKIGARSPPFQGLIISILEVRGYVKDSSVLNAPLTGDYRYPSSFNVGAAWTGRFSSSKDPFGRGGNLQNVTETLRHVFIPDAGFEFSYADLKQAESLLVAFLAGDELYIQAHQSGDTHTFVCRLLWPDMAWTGDLKQDKALAKTLPSWDPIPGHDFRFQAKRIQHGSNYGLSPFGIAIIAHIPVAEAKRAQDRFFHSFPYIRQWQAQTHKEVKEQAVLTNPLGRSCRLFGRPWDEHTYKQGLAFRPQSGVADILDLAMLRVWRSCDPVLVQLLAQVHDALLTQHRIADRAAAFAALSDLMTIPVTVGSRTMTIPVEIAFGSNWGHKSDANPFGLEEVDATTFS